MRRWVAIGLVALTAAPAAQARVPARVLTRTHAAALHSGHLSVQVRVGHGRIVRLSAMARPAGGRGGGGGVATTQTAPSFAIAHARTVRVWRSARISLRLTTRGRRA